MDPDRPRRGRRTAQSAISKALRRADNRERARARGRFPPLQLTSAPAADGRDVLAVLPRPASTSGAAPADGGPPSAIGPPAQPTEPAPSHRPLAAAAGLPLIEPPRAVRVVPVADRSAQLPPRRSVLERIVLPAAPGILPYPAPSASAQSAATRARPEEAGDLDAGAHARRVRCRTLADRVTERAAFAAHLEGRQAQEAFRAERARAPFFSFAHLAAEPEPTLVRYQSDRALDSAVEAITTAVYNRIAERHEASRRARPAPQPVPQPDVHGPPETPYPPSAAAALQHPAVAHRLRACDEEIIRLRYALVQATSPEVGSRINLGVGGALGGPHSGPALAPPVHPPPWADPASRP